MPLYAGLVADASVLIDYTSTDETVLTLASRHLGTIVVPSPVLAEVDGLDAMGCERLELVVVDPSLDQLLEAGAERGRGGTHRDPYRFVAFVRASLGSLA